MGVKKFLSLFNWQHRGTSFDAQVAQQSAEKHLEAVQAKGEEISRLAEIMNKQRTQNHFAPRIAKAYELRK